MSYILGASSLYCLLDISVFMAYGHLKFNAPQTELSSFPFPKLTRSFPFSLHVDGNKHPPSSSGETLEKPSSFPAARRLWLQVLWNPPPSISSAHLLISLSLTPLNTGLRTPFLNLLSNFCTVLPAGSFLCFVQSKGLKLFFLVIVIHLSLLFSLVSFSS